MWGTDFNGLLSNVVAKQKKLWSELNALYKESFTYFFKKKNLSSAQFFLNSYFLAFFFFGFTPIYRTFFFHNFSLVCYAVRE